MDKRVSSEELYLPPPSLEQEFGEWLRSVRQHVRNYKWQLRKQFADKTKTDEDSIRRMEEGQRCSRSMAKFLFEASGINVFLEFYGHWHPLEYVRAITGKSQEAFASLTEESRGKIKNIENGQAMDREFQRKVAYVTGAWIPADGKGLAMDSEVDGQPYDFKTWEEWFTRNDLRKLEVLGLRLTRKDDLHFYQDGFHDLIGALFASAIENGCERVAAAELHAAIDAIASRWGLRGDSYQRALHDADFAILEDILPEYPVDSQPHDGPCTPEQVRELFGIDTLQSQTNTPAPQAKSASIRSPQPEKCKSDANQDTESSGEGSGLVS